jgi:dTDP-4-dehydrorhamnose reductase
MSTGLAWITGAGGLIGSYLVRAAAVQAPDWRIRGLTRSQLDLCDAAAVRKAFQSDQPDLVIHCAALSKSPDCEADPALAWRCNVETTELLNELTATRRFIFFSTDLVFDGREGNYSETASVNPLSVYARTKVAAEKAVLDCRGHTVVRTSLTGGVSPSGDRGFNEQLRRAWERGEETRLFTDEFRCPIAAAATASLIWKMVQLRLEGLYHLAGSEKLSRWEIGQLLARHWKLQPRMTATSLRSYSGAPRSPDTSLNCEKLTRDLGTPMPALSESLHQLD